MTTRCRAGLLALTCATAVGCMQPIYQDDGAPAVKTVELESHAETADMSLVIGDEKKLAEMLAKHKGRVVFVDFWATWCGPCVKAFPHTVETHNKYKDKDFATVAVSFDLLADEAKVRKFLAENKAQFDNLLSNYDDIGQDVATAFEWSELPEFRLYDRSGKLRHEWASMPEDLDARIDELLAEKAPAEASP